MGLPDPSALGGRRNLTRPILDGGQAHEDAVEFPAFLAGMAMPLFGCIEGKLPRRRKKQALSFNVLIIHCSVGHSNRVRQTAIGSPLHTLRILNGF